MDWTRLFRISFSGELAYELAVPARFGNDFSITYWKWDKTCRSRLMEPRHWVCFDEKGHAAGNELNGQTTAQNLGLGRMVSDLKDGIGRVASRRPTLIDDTRRLVGFKPIDPTRRWWAACIC